MFIIIVRLSLLARSIIDFVTHYCIYLIKVEVSSLLWCDNASLGQGFTVFQRNMIPSVPWTFEVEGNMFHWNCRTHVSSNTASHLRRPESWL